MEVRIRSKAGSDITLVQALPPELQKFKMPLAEIQTAVCNFGTMCFQEIRGDQWSAWRSRYIITEDAEVRGKVDMPIIELHTAIKNHFRYDWDGIMAPPEKALQFNLSYTPFVQNTVWLKKDHVYDTMDFHLSESMLSDYAEVYPELSEFLNLVHQKKPASIAGVSTLSKKMQGLLLEMEDFHCKPGLYLKLMKARVEIFLSEALEILCTKKPAKKITLTPELREKALQAKQILESRLSDPPSIAELSQLCLSNSYSIQFAFKKLFSKTIDDYSKEMRMDYAKKLLIETNWDLDSIADETGYYDGASFSRFFKREMKTTPGEFRKYGRKQ